MIGSVTIGEWLFTSVLWLFFFAMGLLVSRYLKDYRQHLEFVRDVRCIENTVLAEYARRDAEIQRLRDKLIANGLDPDASEVT